MRKLIPAIVVAAACLAAGGCASSGERYDADTESQLSVELRQYPVNNSGSFGLDTESDLDAYMR